ncbi:MAG: lipocalin family protein [Alistipes sp.]
MKTIKLVIAALAIYGMTACCCGEPKTFAGFIADATMNNVVVKALTSDTTYTFSIDKADMSEANGLLIGSPTLVEYKGKLQELTPALKISTDATYAEAIGTWTTPDPINPDSAVMGVKLMVEGVAESINMATMRYTSWELQGQPETILLKGISEGSGEPIEFTQTAMISKNTEGRTILSVNDTELFFTKSNE